MGRLFEVDFIGVLSSTSVWPTPTEFSHVIYAQLRQKV